MTGSRQPSLDCSYPLDQVFDFLGLLIVNRLHGGNEGLLLPRGQRRNHATGCDYFILRCLHRLSPQLKLQGLSIPGCLFDNFDFLRRQLRSQGFPAADNDVRIPGVIVFNEIFGELIMVGLVVGRIIVFRSVKPSIL